MQAPAAAWRAGPGLRRAAPAGVDTRCESF